MNTGTEKDCIQIIAYIKRNPDLIAEQFYDHWENVHAPKVIPWAEKHGFKRYQQIHVAGKIVPSPAIETAPNATSRIEQPTEPVNYDGIAMFLVPSLEKFVEAFQDPYYIEVIEPDERILLDKDRPGRGVLGSYRGKMVELIHGGRGTIGEKGSMYRQAWEDFEKIRG